MSGGADCPGGHSCQSFLNGLQVLGADRQRTHYLWLCHLFREITGSGYALDQIGAVEGTTVRHRGHHACDLKRRDQQITLSDGEIDRVPDPPRFSDDIAFPVRIRDHAALLEQAHQPGRHPEAEPTSKPGEYEWIEGIEMVSHAVENHIA